jgi:hypothetical protein
MDMKWDQKTKLILDCSSKLNENGVIPQLWELQSGFQRRGSQRSQILEKHRMIVNPDISRNPLCMHTRQHQNILISIHVNKSIDGLMD